MKNTGPAPITPGSLSIEQMCRDLLTQAIDDNVVTLEWTSHDPAHCSSGDLVGMANLLNSYFAADPLRAPLLQAASALTSSRTVAR